MACAIAAAGFGTMIALIESGDGTSCGRITAPAPDSFSWRAKRGLSTKTMSCGPAWGMDAAPVIVRLSSPRTVPPRWSAIS